MSSIPSSSEFSTKRARKPPPLLPSGIKSMKPNRTKPWPAGNMYVLVVCGATYDRPNPDQAMFADFMAITMTLCSLQPKLRETGSFLSCFPLDQFFSTSGLTDIKWGPGPNPVYRYTSVQYSTRSDTWWEQVDKTDLKDAVLHWIIRTSQTAQPGDSVNIYLQCHGNKEGSGSVVLGEKSMTSKDIVRYLNRYRPGVRVNCIGSHCYSGSLVEQIKVFGAKNIWATASSGHHEVSWAAVRSISNRSRGYMFSVPYISSLSRVDLPLATQDPYGRGPLIVEWHENSLRNALSTSIAPRPPQTYNSNVGFNNAYAAELLEDMIMREQVDVVNNLVRNHRRRRREYPTLDESMLGTVNQLQDTRQDFAGKSPDVQAEVKQIIADAFSSCAPDCGDYMHADNQDIHAAMLQQYPDWHIILKNLVWRGRQQSAVWDLFLHLVERDFIDVSCLARPIDNDAGHFDVSEVSAILLSLTGLHKCLERDGEFPGYWRHGHAHWWLSIMIVRGGCNVPEKLFAIVEYLGILGEFDVEKFPPYPQYKCDTLACSENPRNGAVFGEWLPQGLGEDKKTYATKMEEAMLRFWAIERVWRNYNGYSQDEYLLEQEQHAYMCTRPELEPGRKYSGAWLPEESAAMEFIASSPIHPFSKCAGKDDMEKHKDVEGYKSVDKHEEMKT